VLAAVLFVGDAAEMGALRKSMSSDDLSKMEKLFSDQSSEMQKIVSCGA
jgi:hypothetical protein